MSLDFKKQSRVALGICLILFVTVAIQLLVSGKFLKSDRLVVWIFDVGQGDAIFIDAPDAQVLIDGGPNASVIEKLSSVMPFWDRSIDLTISTHPHADHLIGLDYVLERYSVDEVWASGQEYGTEEFEYFEQLEKGAQHQSIVAGEKYDLGEGATLTVVWPDSPLEGVRLEDQNTGSVVLLLEYDQTSVLLTADAGMEQEDLFADDLPSIDILKVGHHGSLTSSGSKLLDKIKPRFSIISVGENDYGHPEPIVLDRLKSIGSAILRTDLDGDVRIVSDGGEPQVTVFGL